MLAVVFGVFAAVCWSVHDLLARKFAAGFGPYRMAVGTLFTGALILSGGVIWHGTLLQADAHALWLTLVLGIIYGIAVSSLFMAFSLAPISIVGPFTAGYPALVVVWGLYLGLYPSAAQYAAILLILAGAVVVGRMGPADGGLQSVAKGKVLPMIFFCGLAVVCFAAAVVLGQAASVTLGEIETTFLSRLPAAVFILPFAFFEKPAAAKPSKAAWLGVFSMALLDVAAVCGINYMGRLPGKELGAMGISAYGAISVLLGMIFLKEKVASWQWVGIAMIVFGVGVLGWPG
jgi:drug/metabolite transporter (DMT)-like permease